MEEKKDYSLLRPFDLEAAKRGEAICLLNDGERKFLAVSSAGYIITEDPRDSCVGILKATHLHMAPLAWAPVSRDDPTLRPIYEGDVLWHTGFGENRTALRRGDSPGFIYTQERPNTATPIDHLVWQKPVRMIQKTGWIAINTAKRPKDAKYTHWCSHVCATEQLAREYYVGESVVVAPVSFEVPEGKE